MALFLAWLTVQLFKCRKGFSDFHKKVKQRQQQLIKDDKLKKENEDQNQSKDEDEEEEKKENQPENENTKLTSFVKYW